MILLLQENSTAQHPFPVGNFGGIYFRSSVILLKPMIIENFKNVFVQKGGILNSDFMKLTTNFTVSISRYPVFQSIGILRSYRREYSEVLYV